MLYVSNGPRNRSVVPCFSCFFIIRVLTLGDFITQKKRVNRHKYLYLLTTRIIFFYENNDVKK